MTQKNLSIDAVQMMRGIRDDLSRKLVGMSHEEQRRYISQELGDEPREKQEDVPRRSIG